MTTDAETSFEDRIMQAVVAQFFAPQWQMVPVFDPNSGQSTQQMIQSQSPAARVAYDIYTAKHADIVEAVKERLDVNEIAEALAKKITDDVVNRMTAHSGIWTNYDRDREAMRKLVNERVADELARRALEKMDQDAASS